MMRNRPVRLVNVSAVHPARVRSAATMGEATRQDGAESRVRISIDLGLKTDVLGEMFLSPDEAIKHATEVLTAAQYALTANARER